MRPPRLEDSFISGRAHDVLGAAIGLAVASTAMYFAYGPKGFLYLVGALIAYLSGLLFLKVFKPRRDV